MPKVKIKQEADVTADSLFDIFSQQFGEKYKVTKTSQPGVDFFVTKSGWSGIAYRLLDKGDHKVLRYNPTSPSFFARMLALGIIPILILQATSWKDMVKEADAFIESRPEFE